MTLFDVVSDNLDHYIKLTHLSSMKFHSVRFADHLVEKVLFDYVDFMDETAPLSDSPLSPPKFPESLIHVVTRPTIISALDDLAHRARTA